MSELMKWLRSAGFAIYSPFVASQAWHLLQPWDAFFVTCALAVMSLDSIISALDSTSKRLWMAA